MQDYRYGILMAGWILWVLPFFLMKRNKGKAQQLDRRARWGILLVAAGFALLWQGRVWGLSGSTWRPALAVLFFVPADVPFRDGPPNLRPPLGIRCRPNA